MPRRLIAVDCETDPFLEDRIPMPFIWGAYDGKKYYIFHSTTEFVEWISAIDCYAYAHNGGKFDFMYLLEFITQTRAKIINGRFAEMKLGRATLRDSFSIIPVPLGQIHKDKIDYALMEKHNRQKHMPEIISYLKTDVRVLFDLVSQFRKVAGGALTIASNALKNAKTQGVNPGRTNKRFDDEMREFYFGGRTECFKPGTHENIGVVDIVSSYPKAMMQDHATGSERITTRQSDALDHMSYDDINRAFIEIECHSKGAFPKRAKDGGLHFPHTFDVFKVTGWEYNCALKHNLISETKIISVTSFIDKINFAPYIKKWFEFKKSHNKDTDPINYTIGKIMMNSLYGKLAQNPLKYYDYKICEGSIPCDDDDGWEIYSEFNNKRVHRREALWNYVNKYGADWVKRPLFYNVASGASVTGYARAALLDAFHIVGMDNVIYCDTDSISLTGKTWKKLSMGNKLGQWEFEGEAEIGHFAGKKLYGMKMKEKDKKTGKQKLKIACKGSKLHFDDFLKLVNGKTVQWKNKAPTFSCSKGHIPGAKNVDTDKFFVQRNITATAPGLKIKKEIKDEQRKRNTKNKEPP